MADQRSSGPRHAAPRQSVLAKAKLPAGKAIALAAMPTAVFTMMTMTPRLASADDAGKKSPAAEGIENPFSGDECVKQDEKKPDADAKKDEKKKADEKDSSPSAKPSPSESEKAGGLLPKPDATGEQDEPKADEPEPEASSSSSEPKPEPSASETKNPLDPLGVGDKIKDFFTPDDKESPSPSPSTSSPEADEPEPEPTTESPKPKPEPKADESSEPKAEESSNPAKDLLDKAKPKPDATKEADGNPANGKEPFPCPTPDPKALADADVEQGIPALSDTPYTLDTTKLTNTNQVYKGIVKVRTASGKIKPVMKIECDTIDIENMKQEFKNPDGTVGHVDGGPGTTSKFRGGKVTLYVEELEGKLFGLIPVKFNVDLPLPPIPLPISVVTDAKVTLAAQFGGTLTVPGLQQYSTPN
ncbi:hypothetical protein [Streptomyces boninensis]|uniref:hypothetical protein n=1 Tax=Streptomyces boninensis TaxID=2039455 RepID=UPI003B20D503